MSAILFDRRRLRRTARATLMVWLFSLAAGVVNACALTPAGTAERAVPQAGVGVHGPHAGEPTAAGHASHNGPVEEVGNASCLKFCDEESSAIAKLKLPDVDSGWRLLTVAEPWNPIAGAGSVGFRQSLERLGSRGPPLVIRFLRLTL